MSTLAKLIFSASGCMQDSANPSCEVYARPDIYIQRQHSHSGKNNSRLQPACSQTACYKQHACAMQANPHKRLRHLYGSRMMTQYRNVALGELSPHVYAIAEQVSLPAWPLRLQSSEQQHITFAQCLMVKPCHACRPACSFCSLSSSAVLQHFVSRSSLLTVRVAKQLRCVTGLQCHDDR